MCCLVEVVDFCEVRENRGASKRAEGEQARDSSVMDGLRLPKPGEEFWSESPKAGGTLLAV
jgi:hypothetical protein